MSERIETQDVPDTPATEYRSKETTLYAASDDEHLGGTLYVEYRVREEDVVDETLDARISELRREAETPGEFVTQLYLDLVDAIYPGYAARETPWEHTPMRISFEKAEGFRTQKAVLGSYQ